jgi:hypothetical protein
MPVDYTPTLPAGMELPKGSSINTEHADFKALTAVAREEGWSQKSFSRVLALEFQRHERARAAAPAPPAAPAPAKPNMSKWSTSQKFQYALDNPRRG